MVITEAVRLTGDAITTMNSHRPITSRANKAPVYTSDKRAKFTQRENKKWVRLATVVGYLISICIPAIALSVYYVGFWNPQYDIKIKNENETAQKLASSVVQTPAVLPNRKTRSHEIVNCPKCDCNCNQMKDGSSNSDELKQGSKLGSLLSGRFFTASSQEDSPRKMVDLDDFQSSTGSREETFTYGQPLKTEKVRSS